MHFNFIKSTFAKKTTLTGTLAGIITLLLVVSLRAQPTGGRVMSDITLSDNEVCKTAQVSFNFPIRYVNHFPQKEGKELRIQLKPVNIGQIDDQDMRVREAFSPVEDASLLNNVIYEGDNEGGPYLYLQFSQPTRFVVTQGTDFRSIKVTFLNSNDPKVTCLDATSPAP